MIENNLFEQEHIKISRHRVTEEIEKYFPYEADIQLSMSDYLKGIVILCKNPQTPQQWHDHYMKESERFNELADDYHKKAKHAKELAKEALKR